jgi:hypothetical protein
MSLKLKGLISHRVPRITLTESKWGVSVTFDTCVAPEHVLCSQTLWVGTDSLMVRCAQMLKRPKYAVLIRWGTFRLELVGRGQIIAALALIAGLLGVEVLRAVMRKICCLGVTRHRAAYI